MLIFSVSFITLVASQPSAVAYAVKLPPIVTLVSALFIFQMCAAAPDHADNNDSRTKSFIPNITSLSTFAAAGTHIVIAGTNFGSIQGSSVPADIQIAAPVSGTIVKPGQSFSVTVTSPNSTVFNSALIGIRDKVLTGNYPTGKSYRMR